MIHISRVRIDLPREVIINCDITTDETPEKYKAGILSDLMKHNINAQIELTIRDAEFCQHTEKTLRKYVGRFVNTKFGSGKLLEANEGEFGPITDNIRIKTSNGRVMVVPAGSIIEVYPEGYCDHYFPATETGYLPCEFCGLPLIEKEVNNVPIR